MLRPTTIANIVTFDAERRPIETRLVLRRDGSFAVTTRGHEPQIFRDIVTAWRWAARIAGDTFLPTDDDDRLAAL